MHCILTLAHYANLYLYIWVYTLYVIYFINFFWSIVDHLCMENILISATRETKIKWDPDSEGALSYLTSEKLNNNKYFK